jgi:uncharacterized protein
MKFYNREKEIAILNKIERNFRIAILGRRRIGKTRLVEHYYGDNSITFFIPAEKTEKEIISNWVDEYPDFHLSKVATFKEFFTFVFVHIDKVIFLDEIQNILKVNKSFIFDLQYLIDKHKPRLVVSGSVVSTMKEIVEEYKSPLYGRFDFIIKLNELDFSTVYKIGKDLHIQTEDIFKLYAVFGGTPKYYELIEKIKKFEFTEFVLQMFVHYPRPLYPEIKTMLKEEFGKEYKMFFSILSAIAQGKNRSSEIAGFVGRKQTDITKYISMLKNDFEIIERKLPLTGGKRGIYVIKNPIFSFWFNGVWRYNQLLELGEEERLTRIMQRNIEKHISFSFETIILQLLESNVIKLPIRFDMYGTQWGRIRNTPKEKQEYEIDICAINEEQILYGECKWKDGVDGEKLLKELEKKVQYVDWSNKKRKETYAIFAKSFKRRIKKKNVFLFDLNDIVKRLQ